MKAQFFIISSVIMIYVIVLIFQYLAGFSDIRLSETQEIQELSYIGNIKNSFIQTLNTSNISNNGDMNKITKDIDYAKNFFKQELLKKGIDFDSKFIFFSNGFESNDFSGWSSVHGTPQIVNYTSYDGANSLYSNGIEYVTENLSGMSEVYVRAYVNFNVSPSNPNKYYFMDLYENSNQILGLGLENDNGAYKLIAYSSFSGPWISPAISIGNGEWHYFELYWLENGTNSTLKTWYDGQLEIINQTIVSGGKGKLINQYNFGGANAVGGTPDLYVDCVAISSDYVGDKCYPDEQNYFDFTLKTDEMNSETEFPYFETTPSMPTVPPTPSTAPQYFQSSTNNTIAGKPTLFSLNWTDDAGLYGYTFSTNNNGTWVNDSFTKFNNSNLTFGYTTIGGSQNSLGTSAGMFSANFTMPENGSITMISAYFARKSSSGTYSARAAIYSDNNNAPNILLANSSIITYDNTLQWYNFSISFIGSANTKYWLAIQAQDGGMWNYNAGLPSKNAWMYYAWGDLPNPFGTPNGYADQGVSIYAIYTVTPNKAWSNVTKTLNSTIGTNVQWCVYANDTSNNWNSTSCVNPFSLTTSGSIADNVLNLHFNEANGTSVYDSSIYGNNGIFKGETFNNGNSYSDSAESTLIDLHTANGKYGNTLQFDGAYDHVNVGNPANLNLGSTGTIEAWIFLRASGTAYGDTIVGKNDWPNDRNGYTFYVGSTNRLGAEISSASSNNDINGNSVLNINTWYHVALVWNSTHLILYINGSIDNTTPQTLTPVSNVYSLWIGGSPTYTGFGTSGSYFNGTIDEVRIFNRSLSQAEINAEMQSSLPMSRPIASYSFEEPSGATYVNDTHIWVNGTFGSALSFDGLNDNVSVSFNSIFNTPQVTVAAWVNLHNISGTNYNAVVGRGAQSGGTQRFNWAFYIDKGSSNVYWDIGLNNATPSIPMTCRLGPYSLQLDNWYYLFGMFDNSTYIMNFSVYNQSGNVFNSSQNCSYPIAYNSNAIGVAQQGNQPLNTTVDEVRIWNRTLSLAEIMAEMNKG